MKPPTNNQYDVIVVGAGPIGLATAVLLVRQAGMPGARIAVLDRRIPASFDAAAPPPVDLRVFALSTAGAWDDVASQATPYERMQVWHADVPPHGGDALVFDAAEAGERDLGVIAQNNVLQAALAGAARRPDPHDLLGSHAVLGCQSTRRATRAMPSARSVSPRANEKRA